MDCLVTITDSTSRRAIEISGAGASRFKTVIEATVNGVLDSLERSSPQTHPKNMLVSVQDNGALDVVLGARVEAAYRRYLEARGS
jgi:citrate lyase subunit gamma (acyl carrier protein)